MIPGRSSNIVSPSTAVSGVERLSQGAHACLRELSLKQRRFLITRCTRKGHLVLSRQTFDGRAVSNVRQTRTNHNSRHEA